MNWFLEIPLSRMNSAPLKLDYPYDFKNSQDHLASIEGIPLVTMQPAFFYALSSPRKLKPYLLPAKKYSENLYVFWKAAGLEVKAEQR